MSDDIIGQSLEVEVVSDDKKNLSTTISPNEQTAEEKQIEVDAKYVRDNLYRLIENGHQAVEEMMLIADQSQHPRSYEVLSNMIKQMVETNKDLLSMHEQKKKLMPESSKTTVNNNNLFVGSTTDLLKMLNDTKDDTDT